MKEENRLAESEKLCRESLAIDQRSYGDEVENANTANALNELARIILRKGDITEPKRIYLQSFGMKKLLNLYGFNYWKALFGAADEILGVNEFDEAEQLFRDSLAETRRLYGGHTGQVDVACVLRGLGWSLCEKGDYKEAEINFSESLSMEG